MSRLRIALVSPLFESVPPRLYGGTERVVYNLAAALALLGHHVTLYASGDSLPPAGVELRPTTAQALRLSKTPRDALAAHTLQLERVTAERRRFDVIHFHVDTLHYPLARHLQLPAVTTLHGRLDHPDHLQVLHEYPDAELISISQSQRTPLAARRWRATVYHGLPRHLISPGQGKGGYLAFLGRISPEKRVDRAVEIARLAGKRLRVAAKVDPADREYHESVSSLLAEPHVDFVGEIGEREKESFLGGAEALLFPIDWPEPFGLVMIEALAAGTPVIAWPNGSVPEVIRPGLGGFLVNDVHEAAAAVGRLPALSRRHCRTEFETRFTAERMAQDYVQAYREVIRARSSVPIEAVA